MSSIFERRTEEPGRTARAVRAGIIAVFLLAILATFAPAARAQAPMNDFFTNYTVIAGASGTQMGSNVGATHETNEPIHYLGSPLSRSSVWFRWTAPSNGVVTFDTIGSSFDTILAAYTLMGTNTNVLNVVQIASDDDSGAGAPFFWSLITFPVTSGMDYYIAVDGYRISQFGFTPDSGTYVLNWRMSVGPPVIVAPDTIVFVSTNYTVAESGASATITVAYGGDGGLAGGANVSVDFNTRDGTAIDGTHYRGTNGTLIFTPGQMLNFFTVPVIDNTNLNNARTVFLSLTNATNAVIGFPSNAVLTIEEDATEANALGTAGGFGFTSGQYVATEFETIPGPFALPPSSINARSPRGVVITVTRSAPAEGRVLVDFATAPPANPALLPAKEDIDYTPASGTLIFDDYQMSATIVIPVFSDFATNIMAVPADKFFDVVLSNPRPDPLELTNAPDKIVPFIDTARATVRILDLLSTAGAFSIERATYRVDEHSATNAGITTTTVSVDVCLPGGGPANVSLRVGPPGGRYAFPLMPASDYADGDDFSDAYRTFPNTPYTDGTATITNPADFQFVDMQLNFPARGIVGARRQTVTFTITNDTFVEFNEDIFIELYNNDQGHGINHGTATITILYDDQPAGAVDREWNPEGIERTQPPFYNTPGANNTVAGVAVQPDSRTVLVGDFTAVNSVSRNRIARLNPDGSIDLSFNPGTGADGHVEKVLVYTNAANMAINGKMLVCGDFTSINNIQRRGLARLNANGSLDTTFNVGTGADGPVRSLTVQSDGKVLVAGDFQHFNDLEVNGLMRLNEDGSLDSSFNPGRGANGSVWAVAVRDTAQAIFAPREAAGTEFEDVNVIDTGANQGSVTVNYDFLVIPDNIRIYYDGVRILDLTTNMAGQLVIPYGPGLSTSVTIIMNEGIGIPGTVWFYQAFVTPVVDTRTIYVAGEFTAFDGQARNGVARLLEDGSVDPAFDPGVGVDGPVYAIAVQANNRLLIGGDFSSVQNSPRSNIARLLSNGNLDLDHHVGAGVDGPVYTMLLDAQGKTYIGGRFTSYNYTRRIGMARLLQGGSLDTSFLDTGYNQFAGVIRTYSFEPPRFINSIALQPDGNVMIGGSFTQLGGNFSEDHGLTNVVLFGQYTLLQGGTVFAPFTRADKNTRYNIARLIGGYTLGPGNLEFDPNAQPFAIDENAGVFAATVRRVDGRLGGPVMPGFSGDITAQAGLDYAATNLQVRYAFGAYAGTPESVGFVGLTYMGVPIIDDTKREGDEVFALFARSISNTLVLGGESIPLGSSAGYNDTAQVSIADNDFDHGEFNFTLSNFVTNETAITARISVVRTNGSSGAVAVDYLILPGTAVAGQNYVGVAGPQTLNFAAGQTNGSFTVTVLHNPSIDPDRTVLLILTNATGGATLPGGSPTNTATATLTIVDTDFAPGHLNFGSANYVTNENAGFVSIVVTRTGGTLGALTVQYQTDDGTATAPADYTASSGTLSWNSGESTSKTFLVPLITDGIVEPDENFSVRLLNPSLAGALGSQSNTVVTIKDSDAYGSLSFSEPYYETDESGGFPIITVLRRNGSSGIVSVNFGTVPIIATNGVNYFDTNGVLTFLPGEVRKSFRVPIIDNNVRDGDKTIGLVLSNPVNATVGSISNALLRIVDDESISLPAGSLDPTFSDDAAANGSVYAVILQTNNSILMAGDFTRVRETPRNRLAQLNPDGTLDNSFDIGPGANDSIRALALQSDGRVLVGGVFTTINGTNRNHIARLSTDGKVDIAFDPGAGLDNPVFALLVEPNDTVLAGGSFSTFNGISTPGLVRLNTNGTADVSFKVGAGFNGTVYALGLQSDGKILVGGDFISFNGISRTNLVRLNANGTLDMSFNPALAVDAPVRAILVEPDGRIVIGGSFTNVNAAARHFLARLEIDGGLDTSFLPDASIPGADNTVYAIKQQVDGKLIIGGNFGTFNGVTRNGVTRLNDLDGSTDPTINFGDGANGFVATLAIQSDRKILLGGSFTEYDNHPRFGIARIFGGAISGPGSIEFGRPTFIVSESGTNAVITVNRRGGTTGTASVNYSTLDDTARAGTDYLTVSNVLQFPEGETRRFFLVPILPNTIPDGDRSASLLLSGFTTAVQGPQYFASLLILDDESVLSFTTMDYSVNENSISGKATIGVTRKGGTNTTVSVDFSTTDGTAVAGLDYVGTNGTLVFLPGQTFKNFNVPVINDSLVEGNETVGLHLSSQTLGAGFAISNATLVIVDDDFAAGQFLFTTNNFFVDEFGGSVVVTVLRTNGSSGIVSVRLGTSDGTAVAGSDYAATNYVLTFADGETVKSIAIPIINDLILEPEEYFNLTLSQPSVGTSIFSGSAIVTILDDEFAPSYVGFSTNDFFVTELDGVATISVTRTNSRRGALSVDFSMSNGTAGNADYVATNGTLVFADNEGIKTFTIPIVNDGISEPAETVNLFLSNVSGGFLGRSNATLTIVDSPLPVQFSLPNYTVREDAGTAQISVVRVGPNTGALSVDYRTLLGGSAIGGLDYLAVSGTLTWPAGDLTPRNFAVPIIDNTILNPPKTVVLALSNGLGTATSVLTITDNETNAPVAGPVDPTFNGNFGANATVYAVTYDARERLYVGGDFTQLYGVAMNRIARLGQNGAVDLTFDPGAGANGTVQGIARATNGIYVGGAFTTINNVPRRGIARLLLDGSVDTGFTPGAGANGPVLAVSALPTDQVLIGGQFTSVNGLSAGHIARLNPNGSVDSTFNPGAGPNAAVRAIAVQTNGQVIIGGEFTSVNGLLLTRIARLNADGIVDTSFDTGLGADGAVRGVSVQVDGKIIVVGDFHTINGVPRGGVARLNSNGGVDFSFDPGTGANANVRAVLVQPDGGIVVAGDFTSINGRPFNGIGRLTPNGSIDGNFEIGAGANAPVHSLALANVTSTFVIPRQATGTELEDRFTVDTGANSGIITIDYDFLAIPDNIRIYYDGVRIFDLTTNNTGQIVVPYGPGSSTFVTVVMNEGIGIPGTVWLYTLTITTGARLDNRIGVGGEFTLIDNQPRGRVAVLNSDGSLYMGFDPRSISMRSVYAIGIHTNDAMPALTGKIMVGGDFTTIVGVNDQNRVARLNIDGTLDRTFASGLGFDNTVRALAVQADGRTVVGGFFTSYDLIARQFLARLNPDGSLDNTFNFANDGANVNNPVNALVLQPDDKIVIGGAFTTVYGVPRNSIARVNANGTVDVSFNPGTGANGVVNAVALQADGKVLIGGDFTSVAGVSRFHIARLNANGSLDTAFNPGTGTDGAVNAIAVTSNGGVLIGGAFTSVNGGSAPGIALLTGSGAVDGSFDPGAGANDYVTSIRIQTDGRLVVGGNFTMFDGQVRNRIARLNSDGSLDPTINFGSGANDVINAILLQYYDGKIVIGGSFTDVDGLPRVAVARLSAGTNSGSGSFQFSSPTFSVSENGGSAVITVVRSGGTLGPASIHYATFDGTATSPADYSPVSGTLNFANGENVKHITVPIIDNTVINGDRFFNISLSSPSPGASLGSPASAAVTIVDNDSVIGFSSATYLVNEAGALARITVVRDGGATDVATVAYATGTTGTATPGADFTPVSGTLVFLPGVHIQTFDVPIVDDALSEFDETVPLSLLNATGPAVLGLADSTLTIVDNDFSAGVITFGTNSYFASEDIGGGVAAIEVLRLNGHSGQVTVNYRTLIGTATPGVDYAPTNNGTVTFADGQTNAFLFIRIFDDSITEGNETVPIQLFGPSGGATLGLADATLTIVDNDAPGAFVFSAPVYTISESNAFATISIIRTNGNIGQVNVMFQTSGGSATPTLDYTPVSSVLTFADRQTVRTVNIPILEDTIVEGTETVGLLLSNPTGPGPQQPSIGVPGTATLQIIDDEVSAGFSQANFDVTESLTNVVITVVRTGDTNNAFSVVANTSDGSANAGADYVATTTTLFFAPGVTNQTFTVAVLDDQLAEGDEYVNLTLSSASGGVSLGPIATARLNIIDNDTALSFSSATYATNEGFVNMAITVIRTGFLGSTSSVDYATFDGTATQFLDYFPASGTVFFAPGQTSATFTVFILDDTIVENNETIGLALSNPSLPAFLGPQSTAVITIFDNDTSVGFSQASYVVNEKVTNAVITLVRKGAATQPVQVTFQTSDGTAAAGLDYVAVSTVVSWAANDIAPKTVVVPVINDARPEGAETVNLQLVNPVGATLDPSLGTAVLTIVDDAGAIAFTSASYSVVEGAGSAVVNLVRTGGSNGLVSVQWNATGGTATAGLDYIGTVGTVVFASGETAKSFQLPIVDDSLVEGVETVNFSLSNVTGGGSIGSPSAAVLSIIDNDAGVIVGAGAALVAESALPANGVIDPGETVTLLFALRNAGLVDANNVTASLVYSNGVDYAAPQSQNYGALLAGGNSASRPFTFTAQGTNGTRITATLLVTNNGIFLGPVSFDFVLGAQSVPFQNANAIAINDNAAASPYPATLNVSGVAGPVNGLTVTLYGLSHAYPDDIDLLLMAPNGQTVMLMSDAGGANPISNATVTFDDAAAVAIPDSAPITSGTYRPANYLVQTDPFPAASSGPTPVPPYGSSLSVFNGINPNGVWRLFVVDDSPEDAGTIANGWSLNIAASDSIVPSADLSVKVTDSPDPVSFGGTFTYTVAITNHGPAAASSIMLTNVLPLGANLVSVGPGSFTQNANVLIGSLGGLPLGSGTIVSIVMTAPNVEALLTFGATIASAEMDLNPGNNHASVKTTVINPAAAMPALFAARKNGQLVLSWQDTSTNVVLQTTPSIGSPWSPAPDVPVISNGASTVTVPMTGGAKYFRLHRVP